MTKEEIIDMADKADAEADNVLNMTGEYHPNWHQVRDEIFAKLIAEKERKEWAREFAGMGEWTAVHMLEERGQE